MTAHGSQFFPNGGGYNTIKSAQGWTLALFLIVYYKYTIKYAAL